MSISLLGQCRINHCPFFVSKFYSQDHRNVLDWDYVDFLGAIIALLIFALADSQKYLFL